MTKTPLTRIVALTLAMATMGSGCAENVAFGPPVDPETIHLGEDSTAEDVKGLADIINWIGGLASSLLYDDPWTNWYKDAYIVGIAKLAVMRSMMNNENLFHSYPSYVRTGHASVFLGCPSSTRNARTADGRCNDTRDPLMGATGTRFGHTVPLESIRPETTTLLEPNPREISRRLLSRTAEDFKEVPFLNLLAASWIQFMTHDWFSHGPNETQNPIEVPLASDDPLTDLGLSSLSIQRSMRDPTRKWYESGLPDTYVNEVTHWWDASQIYGSDEATVRRLRTLQGGRLRTDVDGRLPLAPNGVEDTGFNRNWWVGLSMMHELWANEHNAIAEMLEERYPSWNDQRLFDTARLINAALIAKVHTVEWTPAILPNDVLTSAMNANWFGLLHAVEEYGITADIDFLFGIVGNSKNLHDVAFSMPEEFVSVYRMHSLMPDSVEVLPIGATAPTEEIPVEATRDAASHTFTDRIAMADLFHSFGLAHPGQLVLNNYPSFLQELVLPNGDVVDMGTIDIVRDRERGVPRYNDFRRLMQLRPLTSFGQLTDDQEIVNTLEEIYGGDIEKLDVLVGMHAEAHRPTHFGFGETAFQVFILIASRRLQADRFFTDSYNAATYTQEGLDWIDDNTMKSVLLRHHPELAATGLMGVANAFEPWGN